MTRTLFFCSVLFLVPAGVLAAMAWWARRHPCEEREPGPIWARVGAAVSLPVTALLAGLLIVRPARDPGLESALMPAGLIALSAANLWLLRVRPRWAAVSLVCTALLLPIAVYLAAPYFVFDPHEVPPGPNPETTVGYTALIVVLYSVPALVASAFAAKASQPPSD